MCCVRAVSPLKSLRHDGHLISFSQDDGLGRNDITGTFQEDACLNSDDCEVLQDEGTWTYTTSLDEILIQEYQVYRQPGTGHSYLLSKGFQNLDHPEVPVVGSAMAASIRSTRVTPSLNLDVTS
jgi:hypothetical protein